MKVLITHQQVPVEDVKGHLRGEALRKEGREGRGRERPPAEGGV